MTAASIRRRLEAVTPRANPLWEAVAPELRQNHAPPVWAWVDPEAQATFISHAPADLAALLDVVEAAWPVMMDLEGQWKGAIYAELQIALDALEALP